MLYRRAQAHGALFFRLQPSGQGVEFGVNLFFHPDQFCHIFTRKNVYFVYFVTVFWRYLYAFPAWVSNAASDGILQIEKSRFEDAKASAWADFSLFFRLKLVFFQKTCLFRLNPCPSAFCGCLRTHTLFAKRIVSCLLPQNALFGLFGPDPS